MRRMRIGTAVALVAIAALDLTLVRGLPALFFFIPFIAIMFVLPNLVLVQILGLRKPLGTFHLGFIGAGFLYGAATFGLRTRILENLIAWYRWFTGDTTIWRFNSGAQILIAEQALVSLLGLLACLAGGALASYTRARLRSSRRVEPVTLRQWITRYARHPPRLGGPNSVPRRLEYRRHSGAPWKLGPYRRINATRGRAGPTRVAIA